MNTTGPDRLRLAPALTITEAEVREFGDAWASILERAQEGSQ
ncbi:MAG: hypothetical protein R2731_04295 [Nocardioides sp.]